MNILTKTKVLKNLIAIAKVTQKAYNEHQERVKDALWFFESYISDAKPYIDELIQILKKG